MRKQNTKWSSSMWCKSKDERNSFIFKIVRQISQDYWISIGDLTWARFVHGEYGFIVLKENNQRNEGETKDVLLFIHQVERKKFVYILTR
jgi:hypothetical protein